MIMLASRKIPTDKEGNELPESNEQVKKYDRVMAERRSLEYVFQNGQLGLMVEK